MMHSLLTTFAILASLPAFAGAQPEAPDTLRLGALYELAERSDPRHRQLHLHEEITGLTLATIATARRPNLDLSARASYQTETASIPFEGSSLTGGPAFPTPPKDQYEVAAEVGQLVYDGGRITREEALQQRRLAERSAEVEAALYALRPEINAAFFAALLHQEQRAQLDVLADDLAARRSLVAAQARGGAALPSDEAAFEAELIYLDQRRSATEAARRAALRRLELLIGRAVAEGDILAAPDLEHAAAVAVEALLTSDVASGRPEFDRFDRARERALAEAAAYDVAVRPRVSAFARVAVGRPGYDFFDDAIRPYGMVGLRAQWAPFDWGAAAGRSEAAALQEEVIETERSAFEARLRREVLDAVYAVERLQADLASDAHAVALRERIERTALRRLEEGVILAAEYIPTRNDVFEARLRRRTHLVELSEARVRLLTILGIDIPATVDGLREPIAPIRPFEASTSLPHR